MGPGKWVLACNEDVGTGVLCWILVFALLEDRQILNTILRSRILYTVPLQHEFTGGGRWNRHRERYASSTEEEEEGEGG